LNFHAAFKSAADLFPSASPQVNFLFTSLQHDEEGEPLLILEDSASQFTIIEKDIVHKSLKVK